MSNSITASTASPFSGLLLQDTSYNVSANWPAPVPVISASVVVGVAAVSASTPSLYFPNLNYPTVGEFEINIYTTNLTNSSGSYTNYVGLQESSDNVTWNNISAMSASLLPCKDNGTLFTSASSVTVLLEPGAKPYLRAMANVVISGSTVGGITGSFGIQTLF